MTSHQAPAPKKRWPLDREHFVRNPVFLGVIVVLTILTLSQIFHGEYQQADTQDKNASLSHQVTQKAKQVDTQKAISTKLATCLDAAQTQHARVCPSASTIIKQVEKEKGQKGDTGPAGPAGTGVASIQVSQGGELLVTYTTGVTLDAGHVGGQKGDTGKGIASANVESGDLVLKYTDGSRSDLGKVTGTNGTSGRGVAGATIDKDGNLVIGYTDNSSANLGNVRGPKGDAGIAGRGISTTAYDSSTGVLTVNYTDGTQDTFSIKGDQGPPGKDGTDGKDGKDGKDGTDGKDAPTAVSIHVDGPDSDGNCTQTTTYSDNSVVTTNPYACVAASPTP